MIISNGFHSVSFHFRKLHIDSAPFYTSKRVDQLINDVETVYTDTFESGNRARAMKRLRVPPLEEKQSPSVTFRVGIFVGKFHLDRSSCLIFVHHFDRHALSSLPHGDCSRNTFA